MKGKRNDSMLVILLLSFPLLQESGDSIRQVQVRLHVMVLSHKGTAKDLRLELGPGFAFLFCL